MRLRRDRLTGALFGAVAVAVVALLLLVHNVSGRLNSLDDLRGKFRQQQATIAALQKQSAADRQDAQAQQRLVRALQAQVVQLCAGRVGCQPLTQPPAPAAQQPSARPTASRSPGARPTRTARPSPAPSPTGPVPSLLPLPTPTLPVPTFLLLGPGRHLGWLHHIWII